METRWLMGLLQECWSFSVIPAVFTWMTHISLDTHTYIAIDTFYTLENAWTHFFPSHSFKAAVWRRSFFLYFSSLFFYSSPCRPILTGTHYFHISQKSLRGHSFPSWNVAVLFNFGYLFLSTGKTDNFFSQRDFNRSNTIMSPNRKLR